MERVMGNLSDNLMQHIIDEEKQVRKRLDALVNFMEIFSKEFEDYRKRIVTENPIDNFDQLHAIEVGESIDYKLRDPHLLQMKIHNAIAKENRKTGIPKKFTTSTIDRIQGLVRVTRLL